MVRRELGSKRRGSASSLLLVPWFACAALCHAAPAVPTAQALKPAPCPDGRYLVAGAPVLPGDSAPQAIVISGRQVSLGAVCGPTTGKVAARARGTRVKAKWSSCTGLAGRVKLVALIAPTCETLSGTVKARGVVPKRRFTARPSTCDDGVFDVEADEQCEGAVITVNTTTDALGDGLCSFQEAVQASNTSAAVDACTAGTAGATDTVAFDIPGSGLHTITVTSVTQVNLPLTIDGSTQPGYAGVPLIHLTGVEEDLLRFDHDAPGSALKYLMLTNTNGGGLIDGATALFHSGGNLIVGNYFNTDGVVSIGDHGAGLLFESQDNVIGGTTAADRNIFGGQTGIFLQDSSRNLVEGNYFGVGADGVTAISGLPQNGNGIQIFNVLAEAAENTVRGNVITGFLAGVQMFQGAHSNVIVGNHVGVASDGVTARGNGIGILLYGAPNNTIGGDAVADRNVISGNSTTNLTLQSTPEFGTDDNTIAGNFIGADATGLDPVSPNALFGIFSVGGPSGNTITDNVITGAEQGVYLDETSTVASASQNCIEGNAIYGVHSLNPASAPFADNWWGDATGPRHASGNVGGSGDWVSDGVLYAPFLASKPASCVD